MRNMFIVSVEAVKDAPTAKGIQTALENHWGYFNGVRFSVEEGGHKEVAKPVSDYLDAEEALDRFESAHRNEEGQLVLDASGKVEKEWRALYDDLRTKRQIMVSKLREYGCVV